MQHYFVSAILLVSFYLRAQRESLSKIELELHKTGRIILEHYEYAKRDSANRHFIQKLLEVVSTKEGFDYPFACVDNMLRLEDEQGSFRLFTWQIPDTTFRYIRHGLVVVKTRKEIKVSYLQDQMQSIEEPCYRQLKPEKWYGALYYKMIPVKKGRTQLYTLLGYAPGKELNRKVIDVIEVKNNGKVRFGAKVFYIDQLMDKTMHKPPMRLILAYGTQYSASVKWNEKKRMIIIDHLSPPNSKLKGVYHMYGPDFSYDGLKWKDGWWYLHENIKFNAKQDIPFTPPDRPIDLSPLNN